MDADQIRSLKPMLTGYLKRFANCFARKDTRGHLPVVYARTVVRFARHGQKVDAVLESRVVRLRPILLTAGAAMLSAVPITLDPIFSGLGWSPIFGLFASTVFTMFVIPVCYWLVYEVHGRQGGVGRQAAK